jgi:hypothetical protein
LRASQSPRKQEEPQGRLKRREGYSGRTSGKLLDKYAGHGAGQFAIPEALEVPPISDHGNVVEIAAKFAGADRLTEAVQRLQEFLYAA